MKKVIVEFTLRKIFQRVLHRYLPLDKIESLEMLEMLRIDLERGIKMVLASIVMKEGYTIDDVMKGKNSPILAILQSQGSKYLCIARSQAQARDLKIFKPLAKKFDLNVIWATPTYYKGSKVVCSVIGDEKNLQRFVRSIQLIGSIETISFQKATYEEHTILSCLTDKQREVIIAAKNSGYYEYPRQINSDQLSQKIGISKATTIEHLRKAEGRIMATILTGY